jgi:hypothetical protein
MENHMGGAGAQGGDLKRRFRRGKKQPATIAYSPRKGLIHAH